MYAAQHRCMTSKIDVSQMKLIYFITTCIITHKNNVIKQNINVSTFGYFVHKKNLVETSSEIILNVIISFIRAQLTHIICVLIATGKPAKCRPELDGENGNVNTASRNRIVSRLSARFPLLNLAGDDGYIGPSFPLPLQSQSPRKLPL